MTVLPLSSLLDICEGFNTLSNASSGSKPFDHSLNCIAKFWFLHIYHFILIKLATILPTKVHILVSSIWHFELKSSGRTEAFVF